MREQTKGKISGKFLDYSFYSLTAVVVIAPLNFDTLIRKAKLPLLFQALIISIYVIYNIYDSYNQIMTDRYYQLGKSEYEPGNIKVRELLVKLKKNQTK